MRRRIVELCDDLGVMVDPGALRRLERMPDPCSYIRGLHDSGRFAGCYLTLECLLGADGANSNFTLSGGMMPDPGQIGSRQEMQPSQPPFVATNVPQVPALQGAAVSQDTPDDSLSGANGKKPVSVRYQADAADAPYLISGDADEFHAYMADRFARISKMFEGRNGAENVLADPSPDVEGEMSFVGMVRSKRMSKTDNLILTMETPSRNVTALVNPKRFKDYGRLIEDDIVLLKGTYAKDKDRGALKKFTGDRLFFVNDVLWPSLPVMNWAKLWKEEAYAAFIGDLHVGSRNFLKEEWASFVAWLNSGEEIPNRIRHLVVIGDLVDGVGVYPNQRADLELLTYDEQYARLSQALENVPAHMKLHLIPGNHDAVPLSEPQPPLPGSVRALISREAEYHPNPAWLDFDGFRVLAYHGASIFDMVSLLPNVKIDNPIEAMREMLDRRHLAPYFGGKTPLLPLRTDHHVIDSIPNVLVTGHLHTCAAQIVRGIVLINASTWQAQTDYQKAQNFKPDPAKVVLVNLKTGKASVKSFLEKGAPAS